MKRKATALPLISVLLTSLLLVASVPSLKAVSEAPQIEWSKTYPRSPATTPENITHIDGGRCFVQTSEGGYAIAGYAIATNGPHGYYNQSALLIKTDSVGEAQWRKTYSAELGYPAFSYAN